MPDITSRQTAFAAIIITIAAGNAAQAGSNTCEGTVKVGPERTTVVGETGDYAPNGCQFSTASKLGRRILAVCPDGSACMIDVSLKEITENKVDAPGTPPRPIKAITSVTRIKQ